MNEETCGICIFSKSEKKQKMKFFAFLRVWSFEIFVLLSAQDTTMPLEFKTGKMNIPEKYRPNSEIFGHSVLRFLV